MFAPDGKFLRKFGSKGSGNAQFHDPFAVAFDAFGHWLIADASNNRVQVLKPDGSFVTAFGTKGSGPGQFEGPRGVCIDGQGHVLVADSGNNRVQVFSF